MRTPAIKSFIRLKQRNTVLLPQPDGPMMAVILFVGAFICTSRTAQKSP